MGKKNDKKSAKGRLDKFYWLAKEQGFRSRAAFKLVQLNKKYSFLESARCCIDLCAAPGGWMQVASKTMPPNSIIVGVDLVPIKPVPRCVSFAQDINSYKCRDLIRNELKDWKADVVLHDGAPNVGTAWVQDAYQQSELVLQSLKLAVEFLCPGGTFVTKVFRSKDYNSLLWVFNQLFEKVEATKPPSSRNVSAEIFVVCQNFKAPKRIDPKFLDPRHVFKDLDTAAIEAIDGTGAEGDEATAGVPIISKAAAAEAQLNVFEPHKKRRKRDGYDEGEYTLFKEVEAHAFIQTKEPVSILGTFNKLSFRDDESKILLKHSSTSADILDNCKDLKVLGKKDFRNLLKWRLDIRTTMGLEAPKEKVDAAAARALRAEEAEAAKQIADPDLDDEEAVEAELTRREDVESKRRRKERRRKNEAKQRATLKMQLGMGTPMDIGMELIDETREADMSFDLPGDQTAGAASDREDDESDEEDTSGSSTVPASIEEVDDDEVAKRAARLEADMDEAYNDYRTRVSDRDAKFRARQAKLKDQTGKWDTWTGIKEAGDGSDEEGGEDGSEGGYDVAQRQKEVEETFDTDDEDDERDEAHDARNARLAALSKKRIAVKSSEDIERKRKRAVVPALTAPAQESREARLWFDNPLFKGVLGGIDADGDDENEDDDEELLDESGGEEDIEASLSGSAASDDGEEDSDEEEDGEENGEDDEDDMAELDRIDNDDGAQWDFGDDDIDAPKRKRIEESGLTTAEAMTLAQALVNRERTKSSLVDSGFTKANFTDRGLGELPSWFLDDEAKHWKAHTPVTKEGVEALRARLRALDARPIKKVAEAKARKKMRTARRLEKARQKAETLNEAEDATERQKAEGINKVLAKAVAAGSKKKNEVKLVVAKGVNRGLKGRPKGTKGRYKMVDKRMKKEMRAQKRIDKRDGKKRSSSTSGRRKRAANGY